MEIDPTVSVEDQTGKFMIICAINAGDKKPYPLVIDKATGELLVNAEFTGDVIVDIDLPEAIDPSIAIVIPDLLKHQLASKALKAGLRITADRDNTGQVWIGSSSVAVGSGGEPLDAGESIPIVVEDADKVYYIADTATDIIYVTGG